MPKEREEPEGLPEIAIVGDLTDNAGDLAEKLIGIPPGSECVLYFDSPGGNPYSALSLVNIIRLRGLKATGIVTGECSSAALWPFAACERRFVMPLSVLLFHPMKWQSEENVGLSEAAEWARHFAQLEGEMDAQLADLFGAPPELIKAWSHPGRFVSGRELAEKKLADLLDVAPLPLLMPPPPKSSRKK